MLELKLAALLEPTTSGSLVVLERDRGEDRRCCRAGSREFGGDTVERIVTVRHAKAPRNVDVSPNRGIERSKVEEGECGQHRRLKPPARGEAHIAKRVEKHQFGRQCRMKFNQSQFNSMRWKHLTLGRTLSGPVTKWQRQRQSF